MFRFLVFLISLLPTTSFGQSIPEICARHIESPQYPQMARLARISGSVMVRITISPEGAVSEAEGISGPAVLRDYAVQNVRKWVFEHGKERHVNIQFKFVLQNPALDHSPPPVVTFDLPNYVVVTSSYAIPTP